ncbi:MAG: PKD domain-containing protein [Spartobacteria bacterium]|nr:PKD domain-containing protein [Spartobacteria bacterium]
MKENKTNMVVAIVVFMIGLIGLTVCSTMADAAVTVSGNQILVDGVPFTIKGVGYSPVPIGTDMMTDPPYGDYFTIEYKDIYGRDLALMRQMGVNTIRLWAWRAGLDHSDFLDAAYNGGVDPIYVIIPGEIHGDITDSLVCDAALVRFQALVAENKDHPAVLMWAIGNELNHEVGYGNPVLYEDGFNYLFPLVNQMAQAAHAEEGASFHPVIMPLADIDVIDLIIAYEDLVPDLDVWGIQPYRGTSFGSLFIEYAANSVKPLVLTEFGMDAYDHGGGDEFDFLGSPVHANTVEGLWNEMAANSTVVAGGCVMEYCDEWWAGARKVGFEGLDCPDDAPEAHGTCGWPNNAFPDQYVDEEWFGIMRVVDNGDGADLMEPRAVYSRLRDLWSTGALRCDFRSEVREGTDPLEVVFTAYSMGDDVSDIYYEWDFNNDGTVDLAGLGLAVVTNIYSSEADYSVSLVVENGSSETATSTKADYIQVRPERLTSTITANRDTVVPGGMMTYTLTISCGAQALNNVVVTATYPERFNALDAVPPADAGTRSVWSLGTLSAHEEVVITVEGRVAIGGQELQDLVNTITVTADGAAAVTVKLSTALVPEEELAQGFIEVQDGYFVDAATGEAWLPHGMAYQTWNRPLGVWQTHEQLEYDLDEMVKMGCNSLRVDFVWQHIEQTNDVFSWENYDFLVQACEDRDIRLFALLGYQWPPSWFPEEWMTQHPPGKDSEGIMHTNRWPSDIINYEHPLARAEYAEWIATAAERYKDSKAIAGWIVGNEYGYLGLWSLKYDGYDPWCEQAFRDWCEAQYTDIATVNANWGTSYNDFDEIVLSDEYAWKGPMGALWSDMVQWHEDSIASFTATGAVACKTADTNHLIGYSTVGMQWGEEDWRYHAEDRGKITAFSEAAGARVDFFAVNNYPWGMDGHGTKNGHWGVSYTKKTANVPVIYSETGFTSSEILFPGVDEYRQGILIRNSLWEGLEAGACGTHIFTWQDRPYMTDREKGFGIVYADRRIKPAFWECRKAYNMMDQVKLDDLLMGSEDARPDVAYLWLDSADSQYCRYENEMQQEADALERLGYEPNFILSLEELASGAYTNYGVLILPRNMRLDPIVPGTSLSVADYLRTVVISAGVNVLAVADLPGQQDRWGKPRPDMVAELDALFGIDASDVGGIQPNGTMEDSIYWDYFHAIDVRYNTSAPTSLRNFAYTPSVWKFNDRIKVTDGTLWAEMNTPRNLGFERVNEAGWASGWMKWGQNVALRTGWNWEYQGSNLVHIWDEKAGIYQDLDDVIPGERYSFGAYLRNNADDPLLNGSYGVVVMEWYDTNDTLLASVESDHLTAPNSAWDFFCITSVCPANADMLRTIVKLECDNGAASGPIHIDGDMWVPAVVAKDHGVGKAVIVLHSLECITDIDDDGQPERDPWEWRSRILAGIIRDYFGFEPRVQVLGDNSWLCLPEYRTCADGSTLWQIKNYMYDWEDPAAVKGGEPMTFILQSDMFAGKTIKAFYQGQILEQNSDGTIELTLDPDGMEMLHVYDAGGVPAIDHDGMAVYSYGGASQDVNASQYAVLDDGATLRMWGNNWKAIAVNYTVTADTMLAFDFRATGAQGEINGIGLDNDLGLSDARLFQVWGTQTWGLQPYHTYSGSDWVHYEIPVGDFYTGFMTYLMYANDADAGQATDCEFSNVVIYEAGAAGEPVNMQVVQIVDAPSVVHPNGGGKEFLKRAGEEEVTNPMNIQYDCMDRIDLTLNVAFMEAGDNGDGQYHEIYQQLSAPVIGSGQYSNFWMWIPDSNLNDPDYLSTAEGGQYQFVAWLEDGAGNVIAESEPQATQLKWGLKPTSVLPTVMNPGDQVEIDIKWEDLNEYLSWEVTPLARNDSFPNRVAIYRSRKTEDMYPGHYDAVNAVADWLETLGYSHGNPLDLLFDNVQVVECDNGGVVWDYDYGDPVSVWMLNEASGSYAYNSGNLESSFGISSSGEHTLYGVSASSGGGATPKALIYYATGKDPANALVQLCQDSPRIFPNTCQTGVKVYIREQTAVRGTAYCTSARDVLEQGGSTGNGIYQIDPDGDGLNPISIECNMMLAGGGWTLLTDTIAATVLNTRPGSVREYLYVYNGKWYRSPTSTLVWSWSSGQDLPGTWFYDNHIGTLVGDAAWVDGRSGKALACNGSSDYLHAGPTDIGNAWTISAWFKYPLASTASWNTLTRGSSADHQIIVQRSTGLLGAYMSSGGFRSSGYNMFTLDEGWHHIAAVGASGSTKFYMDGVEVGSIPYQSTSDILAIGNYQGGGQQFGVIDEVAVYPTVALSASSIEDIYSGTHRLFSADFDNGSIAGWRREAGSGNWTVDAEHALNVTRIGNDDNIVKPAVVDVWDDYIVSADIQYKTQGPYFNSAELYFRYQDRDNYYRVAFRNFYGFWRVIGQIKEGGDVQATWIIHNFTKATQPEEGEWYNLAVKAEGNDFTLYLDNEEIGSFTTNIFASGGIALGTRATQLGIWEPQKGYYFIDDDEYSYWAPEGEPTPNWGTPLDLDWGYLQTFFPTLILPGTYVMSDAEVSNVVTWVKTNGMHSLIATDGGVAMMDETGAYNPGRIEELFGVHPVLQTGMEGIERITIGSLKNAKVVTPVALGAWPFDEMYGLTAFDISGNENDGTIVDATWDTGHAGAALAFDGSGDYVEIADSPVLDLTETVTLSAWVKLDSYPTQYSLIATKGNNSSIRNYAMYVMNDGRIHLSFYNGAYYSRSSASAFTLGEWHHVVGVINTVSDFMAVYVDGELITSWTDAIPAMPANGNALYIGSAYGTWPTDGAIDDLVIYDRALNAQQVSRLYNGEEPGEAYVYGEFEKENDHYVTLDYEAGDQVTLPQGRSLAWSFVDDGDALATIDDGINTVPALLVNTIYTENDPKAPKKVICFNFAADQNGQLTNEMSTIAQRAFEWVQGEAYKVTLELKYSLGDVDLDPALYTTDAWILSDSGEQTLVIDIPEQDIMTGNNMYWVMFVHPWDATNAWLSHNGFYTSGNDGIPVSISGQGLQLLGAPQVAYAGRAWDLWPAYNTCGEAITATFGIKEKDDLLFEDTFCDGERSDWSVESGSHYTFIVDEASGALKATDLYPTSSQYAKLRHYIGPKIWRNVSLEFDVMYLTPNAHLSVMFQDRGPYGYSVFPNLVANADTTGIWHHVELHVRGGSVYDYLVNGDVVVLNSPLSYLNPYYREYFGIYAFNGDFLLDNFRMVDEEYSSTPIEIAGEKVAASYTDCMWASIPDYDPDKLEHGGTCEGQNYEWYVQFKNNQKETRQDVDVYFSPRLMMEDEDFPYVMDQDSTVSVPVEWEHLSEDMLPLNLRISLIEPFMGILAGSEDYPITTTDDMGVFDFTVPAYLRASDNYMWSAYLYAPDAEDPYEERIGLDDTCRFNTWGFPVEPEEPVTVNEIIYDPYIIYDDYGMAYQSVVYTWGSANFSGTYEDVTSPEGIRNFRTIANGSAGWGVFKHMDLSQFEGGYLKFKLKSSGPLSLQLEGPQGTKGTVVLPQTHEGITQETNFVPTGCAGAGVVASDGTYLYVKRWSTYPGPTTFNIIGSGFGGTVAGQNYGAFNEASATGISATYCDDGYIYSSIYTDPTKLEQWDPLTGAKTLITIPGGLMRRDTGAADAGGHHLITSDGEYIYNLAYAANGGSYNVWTVRAYDPFDWSIVNEFAVTTTTFYADGVVCDGESIYPIEWLQNNYARMCRIDLATHHVVDSWTINQGDTRVINGQYDWVNDKIWLGSLQYSGVYMYSGTAGADDWEDIIVPLSDFGAVDISQIYGLFEITSYAATMFNVDYIRWETTFESANMPPYVNAGMDHPLYLPALSETLNPIINDDGLPDGTLNVIWSQISGPSGVTFDDETAENPTVTFPGEGVYVLRVVVDDGVLNGYDEVTITVKPMPQNQAPVVYAGENKVAPITVGASLHATVTDDFLPVGADLIYTWSQVSGPGTASFASPTAKNTTVQFSEIGVYVLRLSVSDTELSGSGDVIIQVVANVPPIVNAGEDATIEYPETIFLDGVVADDGLPEGAVITYAWRQVSGPGTVSFNPGGAQDTTASFSEHGIYVLRLSADDTEDIGFDEVTIEVLPQNFAPVVDAGLNQVISLPANAQLDGTVTDDGLPDGSSVTVTWSVDSGPGGVTFGDNTAVDSTVDFLVEGAYVLKLEATDGQLTASDTVTIEVLPSSIPIANGETLNGSIEMNGTWDWYSFSGRAGDKVYIRMTKLGGTFRSHVSLYDPDGAYITYNYNDNYSAGIEVVLAKTGTYMIKCQEGYGTRIGDYTVSIGWMNPGVPLSPNDTDITETLENGDVLTGAIDAFGDIDTCHFEGTAGDKVSIRMTKLGGTFRSHVTLYDPDGEYVTYTYNDNYSAHIEATLTKTGTYTIRCMESYGTRVGSYTISICWMTTGVPLSPNDMDITNMLHNGEVLNGTIDAFGDMDTCNFEGTAGDKVSIRMTKLGGTFRSHVTLYDPDGEYVTYTYNDNYSAHIEATLTKTGTYTIRCMESYGTRVGSYTISICWMTTGIPLAAADTDITAMLHNGEVLSGTIDAFGDMDTCNFEGTAGDKVSIRMTKLGGTFRSHVTLYDPDGEYVTYTYNDNYSAHIEATLAKTGTYTIRCMESYGTRVGSYTISICWMTPGMPSDPSDDDLGEITNGETLTGTMDYFGDMDTAHFEGTAGDVVYLRMTKIASTFRTHITLYDPDGEYVTYTYNDNYSAGLEVTLAKTGTYTIRCMESYGTRVGDYTLSIGWLYPNDTLATSDPDIGLITDGETIQAAMNERGDIDMAYFEAEAGDVAQISMAKLVSTFRSHVTLYDPDGLQVTYTYSDSTATIAPTLTKTGVYTVRCIESYGTRTGNYKLTLNLNP